MSVELLEPIEKIAPHATEALEHRVYMNFGPQHPATHGTLRLKLELDGETIVHCEPELGYLHTGFEKLGEYRSYNQFVTLSDRMNYMSPLNNNIGWSLACEELFGIDVPERGQILRVVMSELSRIADHVICTGLQAMDLGAFSIMLWTFIEREKLYDIFEAVTGTRLTTSWTRIGGIFRDVPVDFSELVNAFLAKFPAVLDEIERMLNHNKIFKDRTVGIGALSREDAISFGVTGPMLRACGEAYDIRRARPYLGYERFDFEIPTERDGDVFARYRVRMLEMRQSLRIIEQALAILPSSGPVNNGNHKIVQPPKDMIYHDMESLIMLFKQQMQGHGVKPPQEDVYSSTESPNGELGYYIVSDGSGQPYRVRVRPPCFYSYATLAQQITGRMLSDAVACMSSINVISGELDR